jgi:effector-binding domain-containing protein
MGAVQSGAAWRTGLRAIREISMLRPGFLAWFTLAVALMPVHGALAQNRVQTQTIDPFGQEVMLPARTIVYMAGSANWDSAFETLADAFKAVNAFLDKAGVKPAGQEMTIYTSIDDTGFEFQAAVPIAETPKLAPEGDIAVGTSPEGKALKFVHRGAFESTVSTYDAITHYLDEKMIDAQDLLIEEYVTDLASTPDEKLVINIFVPLM